MMYVRSKSGYTKEGLDTLRAYAVQLGFQDDVEFYDEELKSLESVPA